MKPDRFVHIVTSLVHIWITRRRNTGLALVAIGSASTPLAMVLPRLAYSDAEGVRIVVEQLSPIDAVGPIIILIGLLLIIYEKFRGEASPRYRAKSIDMRSLHGATAPKLCDEFSAVIDQAGLHNDLYFESEIYSAAGIRPASEFLPTITSELNLFADGFLRKARNDSLKPFALGAIAHVPFCFALGFLVGNKSQSNYYCWNRDKKKWIDCRSRPDYGSSANFTNWKKQGISDNDIKSIGMSIEISFTSNERIFIESNALDACVKVSIDNQTVGNIFSDVEQTRIVGEIRHYINNTVKQRYPNIEALHFTIMAQASFIMRLAAELNQNHIPKIYVYHYDANSIEKYPWSLELTPGSAKIAWRSR